MFDLAVETPAKAVADSVAAKASRYRPVAGANGRASGKRKGSAMTASIITAMQAETAMNAWTCAAGLERGRERYFQHRRADGIAASLHRGPNARRRAHERSWIPLSTAFRIGVVNKPMLRGSSDGIRSADSPLATRRQPNPQGAQPDQKRRRRSGHVLYQSALTSTLLPCVMARSSPASRVRTSQIRSSDQLLAARGAGSDSHEVGPLA